jgi:uncharacterized protein
MILATRAGFFMAHHENNETRTFACDAMLGGLARWLRAAGYDASWHPGIDDWDLIRLSRSEGRTLLSCDSGIFRIGSIRDGHIPALFIPVGLSKQAQLDFVFKALNLDVREPRCMNCGGVLASVDKNSVREQVPPRSFSWIEEFFSCTRCSHIFWKGTHWRRISESLRQLQSVSD